MGTDNKLNWGYERNNGPGTWADLDPEYKICGCGKKQSPIDLQNPVKENLQPIVKKYKPVPLVTGFVNHSLFVQTDDGGGAIIGGETYRLMQYHFHAPAEHLVNSMLYPVELHLVHQNSKGNLAVIGIFFEPGAAHENLATLLSKLPDKNGELTLYSGIAINPDGFFPDQYRYYQYEGSLTTPPCSEGVFWTVLEKPAVCSREQITQLKEYLGCNARPVQPLNERKLFISE